MQKRKISCKSSRKTSLAKLLRNRVTKKKIVVVTRQQTEGHVSQMDSYGDQSNPAVCNHMFQAVCMARRRTSTTVLTSVCARLSLRLCKLHPVEFVGVSWHWKGVRGTSDQLICRDAAACRCTVLNRIFFSGAFSTFGGSFSAVWRATIARVGAFCSVFQSV